MKGKKLLICLLSFILVLSLAACGKDSTNANNTNEGSKQVDSSKKDESKKDEKKKDENKKAPLDALKDEFKKNGFEVGENKDVFFGMIGATNGYKYDLNGQQVEFYVYDESKLTDEGKKQFEQAKNGTITMNGFNLKVNYINGFVIARLDEHKDKDKIIEVVKNFKN